MNKIHIFVHIGQSKTGTSYIQKFLDINRRDLFSKFGYLYPNFFATDLTSGHRNNHYEWYQSIKNDDQKLQNDINYMLDIIESHEVNKVILSNEGWETNKHAIEVFSKIRDVDKRFQLSIICYLRRVDFWVESAWKQWGLKAYENIEAYYQKGAYHNKYQQTYQLFTAWEELIGKENLIVRPYEKQLLNKGLLNDFLENVGVDIEAHEFKKVDNVNAFNAGFNRDVLEILHHCRDLYDSIHDNHLFQLFNTLLGDKFRKKPFEPYSLLSPEQRLYLVESNLPYENKIAREFMGREDGKIFHEPLPSLDDAWVPYEGLTLERALPILIRLIDANNKKHKAIQRRIAALAKQK